MRGLNARAIVSVFLLAVLVQAAPQGSPNDDFLSWTAKRCDQVIRKSVKSEGMGSSFRNASLFPGGGARVTSLSAVWVTETTAKALARKIQLEERQDAKRAQAIRRDLWNNEAYTLLVFSMSGTSIGSIGWASLDVVNPRSTATIFLQDKANKDSFARITDLSQFPYSISNPAIAASVIMRFGRKTQDGQSWIGTLDQQIELEIALPSGGKSRIGFKLKDLPASSPAEL